MSVLHIHLNPRISNYMVVCKAKSILVAPRWLSALFLPITWTFRDKVVEFEHLHIFCERIWQGQCICSFFHRYCQILKFDGSEFITEDFIIISCSWSICSSFQFRFPTVPVFTMVRGFKSHIFEKVRTIYVQCVGTHTSNVNFSRTVYILLRKKILLIRILVLFLSDFLYWKKLIKIWNSFYDNSFVKSDFWDTTPWYF